MYFHWTEKHLDSKQLKQMRYEGDPDADEIVQILDLRKGVDALPILLASKNPTVLMFMEAAKTIPTHLQATKEQKTLARAYFARLIGPLLVVLGHYSLAGGFSSQEIMPVLKATNYLTSPNLAAVTRRLYETTQWVMDVMTRDESVGWEASTRVRLLHAQVRTRLLRSLPSAALGEGVPINQQHMATTLAAFSVLPIWCMDNLKLRTSQKDKEACIAVWRGIGHWMGLSQAILETHFASWGAAETYAASAVYHHNVAPNNTQPAILVSALANQPPLFGKLPFHFEMARMLMGDKTADLLGLPTGGYRSWVGVRLWCCTVWILDYLALFLDTIFPFMRWGTRHADLQVKLVQYLIAWNVGNKKRFDVTKFELKFDPDNVQNEANTQLHTKASSNCRPPNIDEVRRTRRRYIQVMLEPVALSLLVMVVIYYLGAAALSTPSRMGQLFAFSGHTEV